MRKRWCFWTNSCLTQQLGCVSTFQLGPKESTQLVIQKSAGQLNVSISGCVLDISTIPSKKCVNKHHIRGMMFKLSRMIK